MPELLFTRILNGILASPVTALLQLIGIHPAHPQAPIPDHVAMQFLLVIVLTVLFLIVRSKLSVENPGGLQHVIEGAYNFVGNLGHEIIGHGVTLASARLAELNRLFGKAVQRTTSADALEMLSRIYWFTIEFGVLREAGAVKAYGTGLLSSAGEMAKMHQADLRRLELDEAAHLNYDPTHFQPVLFCADSFEMMYQTLREYLVNW